MPSKPLDTNLETVDLSRVFVSRGSQPAPDNLSITTSRSQPWPVLGWGYLGRLLSKGSGSPGRQL
jgi:hypothetical protein